MEGKAIFENSNVFPMINFLKHFKIFFAKKPFSANCHQITYFLWTLEENQFAGIKCPINLKHPPKIFILVKILTQRVEE